MRNSALLLLFVLVTFSFAACAPDEASQDDAATDMAADTSQALGWETTQDSTHRVAVVEGLAGPEAVRYDPEQDVYFVANFNGGGGDRDANGFISRVGPDGTLEELQFMTGTEEAPMHAPRGMVIVGDTLWAADADGLHGFDRTTGEHLAFVDFTTFELGFLNDLAATPDGTIYVTDTGESRLYEVQGGEVTLAVEDTLPAPPNGVTWDAANEQMVLAPWGGDRTFRAWSLDAEMLNEHITSPGGGNFDGIEFVDGQLLAASQQDSSVYVLGDGGGHPLIQVPGRPADIGVDTQRMRVAVPYIALNRVDIWDLPQD